MNKPNTQNTFSHDGLLRGQLHTRDNIDDIAHTGLETNLPDGSNLILSDDNGQLFPVIPAASCLLTPLAGDRVLCCLDEGVAYVLHIISRHNTSKAQLCAPGVDTLYIEQDTLSFKSKNVYQYADNYNLHSVNAVFQAKDFTFIGAVFSLITQIFKRTAKTEAAVLSSCSYVVKGAETRSAGTLNQEVKTAYTLNSDLTMIDAKHDVRINGERITMG